MRSSIDKRESKFRVSTEKLLIKEMELILIALRSWNLPQDIWTQLMTNFFIGRNEKFVRYL